MAIDSPVAILFDASGNPLAVLNGVATPASTPGLHALGSDGTTSRYLLVDAAGRQIVAGAGVSGTPAGGVLSVQGVAGGTAIPVSGTFSAADVGTNNAALPGSSGLTGVSDGTNIQAARGFDLDTGAGTEWSQGVSLRLPGSGGSTAGGTSANPLRTDPTGTTTQPVSAASLPLPTGAATETTLAGVLTTTAFQARINTLGQKAATASTPVVLASDQSAIPVVTSSATATRSDVTSVATNTTLLASNASRKGAIIFNDSTKNLFVRFGAGAATATDFTTLLRAGDNYEVPFGYTGQIQGIWSVANGAARITELT
jgi:hypothetical protein